MSESEQRFSISDIFPFSALGHEVFADAVTASDDQ